MKGVVHFYSETGTEGGYWAFQDEAYIGLENPEERCEECGIMRSYFERTKEEKSTLMATHTRPLSSALEEEEWKTPEECEKGNHIWVPLFPNGMWSYEGLHVLGDRDRLTIFSKENPEEVVWSGEIALVQHELFTEDARGMWIHADQAGIERETWSQWFFAENPAELIQAPKASESS
jgi:hypothetical protein